MREFLRGLELDEETIDTIMAEVGKGYTKLKEQVEELKEQNSNYESQVKELNGQIETNSESLKNLESVTNENANLKAQLQMSDSNVKKEFSKFVTSEVQAKVTDDVDFAHALENYKKENPQYFGDTVVKKVQSSPVLNNGGVQPQSTNDIMNNILRGNRNNE